MTRLGVNILLVGLLIVGLGGAGYLLPFLVPFNTVFSVQAFETVVLLCWGIGAALVLVIIVAVAVLSGPLVAQEHKPVPKDSVRVFIPGCTKGFIFTVGPRTPDEPGNLALPKGMHLRMNGPKKVIDAIDATVA